MCVHEELHDVNAFVYQTGCEVNSIYYVCRGQASVMLENDCSRKLKTIRLLKAGDIWGVPYFEGQILFIVQVEGLSGHFNEAAFHEKLKCKTQSSSGNYAFMIYYLGHRKETE